MIYVNCQLNHFDLTAAWPLLSQQRRDHLMHYRREADRRSGAAAYLLLCQGLHEEYGILTPPLFTFGPQGKPQLDTSNLDLPLSVYFSLSHCEEAAVCAIDTYPVGIDVEMLTAYDPQLLSATMSPREQQTILSAERPDIAFTRLWTMKEALLKCIGTGITDDLTTVLERLPTDQYTFSTFHFFSDSDKEGIYTLCEQLHTY